MGAPGGCPSPHQRRCGMTDRDFFAAMAVGIPPITPPGGPAPAPAEPTAVQETE